MLNCLDTVSTLVLLLLGAVLPVLGQQSLRLGPANVKHLLGLLLTLVLLANLDTHLPVLELSIAVVLGVRVPEDVVVLAVSGQVENLIIDDGINVTGLLITLDTERDIATNALINGRIVMVAA